MTIDAARLEEILGDSLFKDTEEIKEIHPETLEVEDVLGAEHPPVVPVEGVLTNYAFQPDRLETHRDEVDKMLQELQDPFWASRGGGWSFLNLCETRHGDLWGQHRDCERLCVLAIGLGLGKWALPKSMWSVLPGQMPYFMYLDAASRSAVTA